MGTTFSAEKNTSIQETLSSTLNEFITENSTSCETTGGASANVVLKDIQCKDFEVGDITASATSDVNVQCIQKNKAESNFKNFTEEKLKNELEKTTKNMIGINLSLDQNTTITRSIQKVVNTVKNSNILTCLTTNLSDANVILDNIKAEGKCVTGDINAVARTVTNVECIQNNESIMNAVNELNTNIETTLSTKSSGTGIVVMIIIVSIVVLIIFIMIKKMKSNPGMALPMQMPMPQMYPSYSRIPVTYPM